MARRPPPQCPVESALSVIGGRWKILIIYQLFEGKHRFNEMRRSIEGISQRVLAQNLRELERAGVVARKVLPESPPHVEYALTALGQTLEPVLGQLCMWGEAYDARSGAPAAARAPADEPTPA